MLKKFGMVSAGVTAALLAAAPLASAGEADHVKGDHDDWGKSHSKDHDGWGHDKGHHKGDKKGHKGSSANCAFKGGDTKARSGDAEGKLIAATGLNGSLASGNNVPVLSCNNVNILNDFAKDNFNNNFNGNKVEL